MPLRQLDLETGLDKVQFAIQLLRTWEPVGGYYLGDSGGKDSAVARDLLIKAGVKFDAHYCVSPIDPPQIYAFLKEYHPDTQWDFHARGFWKLVEAKGLPMRTSRWCCQKIKEAGGSGRVVVLGNRTAEGNIRKHQCFVEASRNKKADKTFIRPILKFDDYDVWQYIRENDIPYCHLYDEGAQRKGYGEGVFKRLGCVLCPFSRNIERETQYFPKIVANWKRACNRIVERHKGQGYMTRKGQPMKHRFTTGEELYQWWTARD
jgi:phosphoadenosine phosphosulfate reductase